MSQAHVGLGIKWRCFTLSVEIKEYVGHKPSATNEPKQNKNTKKNKDKKKQSTKKDEK